jgi:uncharacterized protein (UPF0332 family)
MRFMIELGDAFLEKSEENLAAATSELSAGRYNASANRAYYAAFHAAICALARVGIRPPGREGYWGHDFVQAQFSGQLVNRRKLYPSGLRSVLNDLATLREQADYRTQSVDEIQARRAVRKAEDLVGAVRLGRTSR